MRNEFGGRIVVLGLLMGMLHDAGAKQQVSSTISRVTVFTDRAAVTRTAALTLGRGEHTLVFGDLPQRIDPNSIQVDGAGQARLHDIRLERQHHAEITDEKVRKLRELRRELTDSIEVIENRTEHAKQEKAFVRKIADALTTGGGDKEVPVELDPDKWVKMVSFYRDKLESLDAQIRQAKKDKRPVQVELDRVNRELADLAREETKVANQVRVELETPTGGKMRLNLTYVVYGPRWRPLYDIRVLSDKHTMQVVYKAKVRQNTREEWPEVQLRLSTAQPQIGGKHPELKPWYLSFSRPRPVRSRAMGKKTAAAPMARQTETLMLKAEFDDAAPAAEPPMPQMEVPEAGVESQSTSVVFVPKEKTTVPNDNQPSTVTVAVLDFPAEFRYSAVPKLSDHAYLKATAVNESEYPFLASSTNVFLDNSFVTGSTLELVAPGEEFQAFLGADDGIQVEHKLIKRYQKKEGLVGRRECLVFEYLITVANKKSTKEEIVVRDQLPISKNEEIQVELVKPAYREASSKLKKTELNFLEWSLELDPGEVKELPLVFEVSYPPGRPVSGL